MNKHNNVDVPLEKINFKFATEVLAEAVMKDPSLFYKKYISTGYEVFIESLRSAWISTSKNMCSKKYKASDIDVHLEVMHIYPNSDILLLLTLPYSERGCDLVGLYIRDCTLLNESSDMAIDIGYYVFYKTNHREKYILLDVNKNLKLSKVNYISACKDTLLNNIYKLNNNDKLIFI